MPLNSTKLPCHWVQKLACFFLAQSAWTAFQTHSRRSPCLICSHVFTKTVESLGLSVTFIIYIPKTCALNWLITCNIICHREGMKLHSSCFQFKYLTWTSSPEQKPCLFGDSQHNTPREKWNNVWISSVRSCFQVLATSRQPTGLCFMSSSTALILAFLPITKVKKKNQQTTKTYFLTLFYWDLCYVASKISIIGCYVLEAFPLTSSLYSPYYRGKKKKRKQQQKQNNNNKTQIPTVPLKFWVLEAKNSCAIVLA